MGKEGQFLSILETGSQYTVLKWLSPGAREILMEAGFWTPGPAYLLVIENLDNLTGPFVHSGQLLIRLESKRDLQHRTYGLDFVLPT